MHGSDRAVREGHHLDGTKGVPAIRAGRQQDDQQPRGGPVGTGDHADQFAVGDDRDVADFGGSFPSMGTLAAMTQW